MIQSLHRAARLAGSVTLPGDKSMSHRYALLSAIAEGTSELGRFATSQDCHSTLRCLQGLGVRVQVEDERVTILGRGLRGLLPPRETLDAGNSGTTLRLLSGLLAGHPFEATISGDESLCRRPMRRVLEPLRLMGAQAEGRQGEFPPITVRGGELQGISYRLPVASAQVKSCILLAGLYAKTTTAVRDDFATRDHTEIALKQFGANVTCSGEWSEIEPYPRLRGQTLEIPGDLSGAAFLLVAGTLAPDSEILLPQVGLNRRRRELLDYLSEAGLNILVENETEIFGEPRGDLLVRHDPAVRKGTLPPIFGKRVAALIDEIPVLAILGCQVAGGLEISDAGELRLKESDRIAAVALNLRAMGAIVEEKPDGLRIQGGQQLRGAEITTHGDHRIAMAFAVAALLAEGETRIHQAECADISFPGFYAALSELQR